MKTAIAFLILCLFATFPILAQSDSPTMDEMFQNGETSPEKFILKTNPITMLSGDFPLYAELRLSRKITFEAGAGFQADYFLREWTYIAFGKQPFGLEPDGQLALSGGFSLRAFPKYYFIGNNFEGLAVGPFWRMRQFGIQNSSEKVRFTDLCLMFSQQSGLGRSQFFLEYYVGFGVRSPHFPDGVMPALGEKHFISPWGVKIGYGF